MVDVTCRREISMRGRVASGLMCLEEAILHLVQDPTQWTWLLRQLSTYTSIDHLDNWLYKVAGITPEVILVLPHELKQTVKPVNARWGVENMVTVAIKG